MFSSGKTRDRHSRVLGLTGHVLQELGEGWAGSGKGWGEVSDGVKRELEQEKEGNKAVAVHLQSVFSLARESSGLGAPAELICCRPGAFGTLC